MNVWTTVPLLTFQYVGAFACVSCPYEDMVINVVQRKGVSLAF